MQEIVQLYSDNIMSGDAAKVFSIYQWVKNNPAAGISDICEFILHPFTRQYKMTLLHLVGLWGPRTLLEAILQHPRCNVNTLDEYGYTAMDRAMETNRYLYTRILCQHGGRLRATLPSYEVRHTNLMVLLLLAKKLPTHFEILPIELLILLDRFLFLRAELPELEEATSIDMFL